MTIYRIQVVQEFFVDAKDVEEAGKCAEVFMTAIAEADNLLSAPYAWDFADWGITEVVEELTPDPDLTR